ncbi:MAG: CDP-alcohol phosphatidyltransferase family protein [Deltaproteobacteria bacterium]|nr:CDP-alcohol phosphatidyltransferase family protein [Deltaproteobacteria bacterium]
MSIYALKPRFQNLLRPLAGALARAGGTANQVTLGACALSVVLGLGLAFVPLPRAAFLLLPPFLVVRMALNALDGMLAREFGQKSHLGAYLNELTDVVSDAALYLPFAFLPHFQPLWVGAVIWLAALSEMTGTVAVMAGASRRYDGPFGKSDRAFAFGALGLAVGLGLSPSPWQRWILPIMAAALAATVANRIRSGLREVNDGNFG